MRHNVLKTGFGLLEITIAVAVISSVLFSLSFVSLVANRVEAISSDKTRASFLAEEALEALRFLRDKSWAQNIASLTTSSKYYLNFDKNSSAWSITTSDPGNVDGVFARSFTVSNVYRDINDDITASGGSLDADTKQFNVSVSWNYHGATSTINLSTYLANMFSN